MSLGGGASDAMDQAVEAAIKEGITFVLAAGNSSADACNSSPARVRSAITVGSTTKKDSRSGFSNYGKCLDIFAPGSDITSAVNSNDSATATMSGTSMASPHVAGAVALILEEMPNLSPLEVNNILQERSSRRAIQGIKVGSPNYLLYIGTDSFKYPNPQPSPDCPDCTVYSENISKAGGEMTIEVEYDAQQVTAKLFGPDGTDFDLFLEKKHWLFGWRSQAFSTDPKSEELIIHDLAAGKYRWKVVSESGAGDFALAVD